MSAKESRWRYPDARFLTILDDPVQALTDGIGQGSVDEGQDVDEVSTQCADERAQCGNATAQGSGHPGPEKLLCRGPIAVCPEVLKLVLEHPGAVDAAIGVPQAIQEAGVALGATSRVHAEEPPQPLDSPSGPACRGHATVPCGPRPRPDFSALTRWKRSMTSVTLGQWCVIAPI